MPPNESVATPVAPKMKTPEPPLLCLREIIAPAIHAHSRLLIVTWVHRLPTNSSYGSITVMCLFRTVSRHRAISTENSISFILRAYKATVDGVHFEFRNGILLEKKTHSRLQHSDVIPALQVQTDRQTYRKSVSLSRHACKLQTHAVVR